MTDNHSRPEPQPAPSAPEGQTDPMAGGQPSPAPTADTASFHPAGPSALPERAPPPAGYSIPAGLVGHPRYRILSHVGSGGMGTVYKAQHILMDRMVA